MEHDIKKIFARHTKKMYTFWKVISMTMMGRDGLKANTDPHHINQLRDERWKQMSSRKFLM